MLAALAATLTVLLEPPGASAQDQAAVPQVTIAFVTGLDEIAELESVDGLSPGLLSAGIGTVRPSQTYLDITQGNRIGSSLYPEPLSLLFAAEDGVPEHQWARVVERADEAPADIVPGLLASTVDRALGSNEGTRVAPDVGPPALVGVDRAGRLQRSRACAVTRCPGLTVLEVELDQVQALVDRLAGDDLLIAIARPRAIETERLLPLGIAGDGFDGNLTSRSTRLRGLVLSTDIAPTVLERLSIPVPEPMNGRPIRSEGPLDAAAVASLGARLNVIGPRRDEVILNNFVIWVVLALAATLAIRPRGGRVALPLLLTTSAYVPAALLLTAAIEPSAGAEQLIVGLGCPIAAAVTLAAARPLAAIAIACGVSVGWHAIDVVIGSPLTALSLLGPSPGSGSRFFGIGNELEATLIILLLLGIGAGVAVWDRARSPLTAAIAFVIGGVAGVAVFAPGAFGADVGVAIALPFGAAVAAAVALSAGARVALLILVAPITVLGLVVVADLALGGDAHLSRSVLQAGGLDEVGDVAQRRISLSASSFSRNVDSPFFLVSVALLVFGIVRWESLRGWFGSRRAALAGFLGAVAATILGTLANDSGALLLMIGTGYVAMFAAVAWATRQGEDHADVRAL